MKRVPVRSLATFFVAVGVTIAVALVVREMGGPAGVRARFGAWALLITVPAHVVTTLTPLGEFIPFGAANGAIYGVTVGALLNWSAWMVAALGQYAFGRGTAQELGSPSIPMLRRLPITHPVVLTVGRWLPGGGPLVDAAAGGAGVPLPRAMAFAALGHAPQAVAIAAVGAGLLDRLG